MKKEKLLQNNVEHIKTMLYKWLAVSLGKITIKKVKKIMKLTKELELVKKTRSELIKEINSPKHTSMNEMIKSFVEYLKKEIGVNEGVTTNGETIYKYTNSDFECHTKINKENNCYVVTLVMPGCFGDGTTIELKPSLSTPLSKITNNLKSEIEEIESDILKLKEVDKTRTILTVNEINCPSRTYPNDFKFDKNKEFNTIQDAMEYAVDDIMGNG